jgi:LPS export ABC transporter protein LptC
MRIGVLVIVIVLLGYGIWTFFRKSPHSPSPQSLVKNPIVAQNLTIFGEGERKSTYRIHAQAVHQRAVDTFELKTLRGTLNVNQSDVKLTAPRGVYRRKKKDLQLQGGVTIEGSEGQQIETPSSHIDMAKKVVSGTQGVRGKGPQGHFQGEKFEIDLKEKTFVLRDKPRLTVFIPQK